MTQLKIGINGSGRIGRMLCRVADDMQDTCIVAINDPNLDAQQLAYLLKFDSVQGRYPGDIEVDKDDNIVLNGKIIHKFDLKDPAQIPWNKAGVDFVFECSGCFCEQSLAGAHLKGGAKKVIISAPPKDDSTPVFVKGVNECCYKPDMDIVSNASCTTNCLAPLLKVIDDNFGVEEGLMTTVHSVTASQSVVDGPAHCGKKWRTGRSALLNIVPTTTGATHAVEKVLPQLKGKLTGMAFRVPTANVSVVDLSVRLQNPASMQDITKAIKEASEAGPFKGIIGYTEEEVVSQDFIGDTRSCVFDASASLCLNDRLFKLIAWYDNEKGYAHGMLDLAVFMNSFEKEQATAA